MSTEFPSNSQMKKGAPKADRAPEKKTERIVQSDVVRQKRPMGRRFKDTFIAGDSKSVWEFVMLDVVVPAAKDMLADAFSQGVERMIFGEGRSTSRRTGKRPGESYVAYNRMGGSRRVAPEPRRPEISRRARSSHDFDEIILGTRAEADVVIDRLFDLVDKYEVATVSDLYDLVGITGSFTDEKWGWVELPGAGVSRVRNGYLLDLPKPEPLN